MKPFALVTEWEDPKRAKGAELRATWGSLRIEVAGSPAHHVVTRYFDEGLNTVRNQVYLPLYPLAEWIAYHWFQLLHGTGRSGAGEHDIRRGSEGFALPHLRVWSLGAELRVVWTPSSDPRAGVQFLEGGEAVLPREQVEQELTGFLDKVVQRLDEAHIAGTPLQREWASIYQLDPQERQFCVAAASLGLDPFNLPEGKEEEILETASLLRPEILDEFLPAVSSDTLVDQARALAAALTALPEKGGPDEQVDAIRSQLRFPSKMELAWRRGYELARRARELLALSPGRVELATMEALTRPSEAAPLSRLPRVEGLIARNGTHAATALAPEFSRRREDSRRFALARALCEKLLLPSSSTSILTKERTTRQRVNRSFAAEFLAPAADLRARITAQSLSTDDVQDLADEFGVSTYTIENQIMNHHLAAIEE